MLRLEKLVKRGTDGEVEAKDNQGGVGGDSRVAVLYVEDEKSNPQEASN